MGYDEQYRPGGFSFLPVVTKNIIIINVLVFLATLALYTKEIDLNRYLGLHYYLAPDFKPYQFITYIFMHGSWSHIFFNMFGVFIFGQVLEQVWGPNRYLLFYLLTGLGAALAQYVILHFEVSPVLSQINDRIASSASDAGEKSYLINLKYEYLNRKVIVGASGSLFGLLAGFGMLFPNRHLYLYFFFPIKAKWLVIAYGAIEIISAIQNDPQDPVAHIAHLGGLLVGVLLVLIFNRNRRRFY
jgi:membrane associated rhomboid family serine protease